MKDVNYPLRKAYMDLLDGITVNSVTVPAYYMEAPDDEAAEAYILLVSPSNNDASTKGSADTSTSIQVQIHTHENFSNAGKLASDIAGAVYNLIYPNTQAVLDMSAGGFQMVSTRVESDRDGLSVRFGARQYVQRIITFSHKIFHQ